ncbi:hypothetical protein [Legionella sp. km772]|uniref:hypothetical protein n=1 Tax=Legionella sp. km772 TaxID=2498111 RepID=UPI000F8C47BE|nr:hypothetical protein [Legionella sp. km772]RUR10257.1 hypothetical protein ELY15_08415 [Legionella sp. km772]
MNKIILGFSLFLTTMTCAFANSTDMGSKWICTTNASSSEVAADKAADDQMAKEQGAAAKSFEFAAKHCRDCTKITCEVQD